jgi:hypothetical protein
LRRRNWCRRFRDLWFLTLSPEKRRKNGARNILVDSGRFISGATCRASRDDQDDRQLLMAQDDSIYV